MIALLISTKVNVCLTIYHTAMTTASIIVLCSAEEKNLTDLIIVYIVYETITLLGYTHKMCKGITGMNPITCFDMFTPIRICFEILWTITATEQCVVSESDTNISRLIESILIICCTKYVLFVFLICRTLCGGVSPHMELKTEKFNADKNKNQDTCAICLENHNNNDDVIILDCKHIYHKDCISEWLREHETCPVCRGVVGSDSESVV